MLLPNNRHPELSIYYNGYLILKELRENPKQNILDLYIIINSSKNMSFPIFVLSLDWLYLIQAAQLNHIGEIELCL